MSITYKDSGVDIAKADQLVDHLKEINPSIGGFGGCFELSPFTGQMEAPMLVSGTDGVGTKLLIAQQMGIFDTLGIDLVAMSVNDILVCGALPLFFLDYLAVGKLDLEKSKELLAGVVEGCKESNCLLLGGETAELPDIYPPEEFDLAGFAVGIVDKPAAIDGSTICEEDVLIGLPSSGIHSNGYSLVRKIIEIADLDIHKEYTFTGSLLGKELLKPTRLYVKDLKDVIATRQIKGLAHITGGGIEGNLIRVLPEKVEAVVEKGSWDIPELFTFLQDAGKISDEVMYQVFNMGLGMIMVVGKNDASEIKSIMDGNQTPYCEIGSIRKAEQRGVVLK